MSDDDLRERARSLMLTAALLLFDDRDTYFALAKDAFDTVSAADHQLP